MDASQDKNTWTVADQQQATLLNEQKIQADGVALVQAGSDVAQDSETFVRRPWLNICQIFRVTLGYQIYTHIPGSPALERAGPTLPRTFR